MFSIEIYVLVKRTCQKNYNDYTSFKKKIDKSIKKTILVFVFLLKCFKKKLSIVFESRPSSSKQRRKVS